MSPPPNIRQGEDLSAIFETFVTRCANWEGEIRIFHGFLARLKEETELLLRHSVPPASATASHAEVLNTLLARVPSHQLAAYVRNGGRRQEDASTSVAAISTYLHELSSLQSRVHSLLRAMEEDLWMAGREPPPVAHERLHWAGAAEANAAASFDGLPARTRYEEHTLPRQDGLGHAQEQAPAGSLPGFTWARQLTLMASLVAMHRREAESVDAIVSSLTPETPPELLRIYALMADLRPFLYLEVSQEAKRMCKSGGNSAKAQ
eukprot:jgi/Mesvir1/26202/Mv02386-RA.1